MLYTEWTEACRSATLTQPTMQICIQHAVCMGVYGRCMGVYGRCMGVYVGVWGYMEGVWVYMVGAWVFVVDVCVYTHRRLVVIQI